MRYATEVKILLLILFLLPSHNWRTFPPVFMRLTKLLPIAVATAILLPLSASALEGIGPRVTITGTVEKATVTEKNVFDEFGGEFIIRATNGQAVTIVMNKETEIISEGRLSRKQLLPINIQEGMKVRVRGWRVGTDALTANLFIIQNIELNPVLAANGTLQSMSDTSISILEADGQTHSYSITNETEVNINYTLYGKEGLSLIGKQALLTLNPDNRSLIRVLRITGKSDANRTLKPTTVEMGRRSQ